MELALYSHFIIIQCYKNVDNNQISMIIPDFKLKQTDSHIQVYIRVPYIKVSASEFYIEQNVFKFYIKPYLLSLKFSQPLKNVQQPAKAIYYHEKYILECHLEKQVPGEHFENLELITNIVNKKQKKNKGKVMVEVVGSSSKQKVIEEQGYGLNGFGYGFNLNYTNVMEHLEQQVLELFAFDPSRTEYDNRLALSQAIINKQFDTESYLYDKYENEEQIQGILKSKESYAYLANLQRESTEIFSKYKAKMEVISGHKELLISPVFKVAIMQQIFSIVFGYVYELVCMDGDFGPESPKTINKTSVILHSNYLYTSSNYQQVLTNCYTRCLTYSLYKSLAICERAKDITLKHLSVDYIKLVLIDLHGMFQRSEPRYLLNKLYINDYIVYVSEVSIQQQIKAAISSLSGCVVDECQLGLKIKQFQQGGEEQGPFVEQEPSNVGVQNDKLFEQYEKLIKQMQDLQALD